MGRGLEEPCTYPVRWPPHLMREESQETLLSHVLSHVPVSSQPMAIPDEVGVVLAERRVEVHLLGASRERVALPARKRN